MSRQIIFYGNYFRDFFEKQNEKIKEKIDYVLFLNYPKKKLIWRKSLEKIILKKKGGK
jgi:hypothetical protein